MFSLGHTPQTCIASRHEKVMKVGKDNYVRHGMGRKRDSRARNSLNRGDRKTITVAFFIYFTTPVSARSASGSKERKFESSSVSLRPLNLEGAPSLVPVCVLQNQKIFSFAFGLIINGVDAINVFAGITRPVVRYRSTVYPHRSDHRT